MRKSGEKEEERVRNVGRVRGCCSLWLLFGHSSSHAALTTDRARQREVLYWVGWGWGVLDGYRGKVSTHCILSPRVDRKAGGPWRVLQKERERAGGILPLQFGVLFPALFTCTMK